ncbi:pectate lyase a, partial [Leptodontidium sp. MPI-SDFR-AT-0119]
SISDACDIGFATQNGGTTGGGSAAVTTCTTLEELTACATQDVPAVCLVSGAITGNTVIKVTADTTVGGAAGSSIVGVGFRIINVSNVILRNLKISKVLASAGDAVGIQKATNVWIDHLDLSSDQDHGKDFYDGLCDVTHASDYVTISNTFLHDHFKASLVGHSDSNGAEDTGHLIVTYANNYFKNINSRGPSIRFGTAHIFNQYSETSSTGLNTRIGAQVLIESSAFSGIAKAIESADSKTVGFATVNDVDLGTGTNTVESGTLKTVPYEYTLLGSANVKAAVTATAGATLNF